MSGAKENLIWRELFLLAGPMRNIYVCLICWNQILSAREFWIVLRSACSFTAIANQLGGEVTAADIAYYYSEDELAVKGVLDIAHAMSGMEKVQDNFVWNYFKSIEGLTEARNAALTASTKDRKQTPEHYVPVVLPDLPFADEAFDLTLSAHFLFMYSDRLDYEFHLETVKELMRVTRGELRIFPLVDLSCKRYEHLDRLIDDLVRQGFTCRGTRGSL